MVGGVFREREAGRILPSVICVRDGMLGAERGCACRPKRFSGPKRGFRASMPPLMLAMGPLMPSMLSVLHCSMPDVVSMLISGQ